MNLLDNFSMGYKHGKHMVQKGQGNVSVWIGGLFGLLIFAYVAGAIGPDIIEQFTDQNISGAEGDIFSLGGILSAAGILAGVGAMVGLKIFG